MWWLLFIPAFAIPMTVLEMLGRGRGLGLGIASTIAFGGAILFVVVLLCMRWRADARYDAVKALWPHGYVVEGVACDPTTAGLFAVGGRPAARGANGGYEVEFDAEGARFYAGARNVVEFLRLGWSQVAEVGVTTVGVTGGRQVSALTLSVLHDGNPTALPLVIKATRGFTGFRFSSPAEIQEHLEAVERIRGTATAALPIPSAKPADQPTDRPVRRAFAPGIHSTTMYLVGVVAFAGGLLSFVAMLPFGILTWTHVWAVPTAVFLSLLYAGLFGILTARLLWIFVPVRERAELRAGYTLSSGGDLAVDQLDPRTGYVIRPAGSPALDRSRARSERLRVRALAADPGAVVGRSL
ncbi:hypothetical protein A0130_12585 [Leifsonia xyli]|nr:hypothetical protein A0130_12585 [Leifsonia xyli]